MFSDKPSPHVVKAKRRPKRHRARTFFVMVVVMSMVVGVGYVVVTSFGLFERSAKAADYAGDGEGSVDVTVRYGDTGIAIAKTLFEADVIASQKAFVKLCLADSACGSIQPGTYGLKRRMSASAALAALLNQNNRKSGRVTVAEGKTVTEIVEKIAASTGISVSAIKAALDDPASFGLPEQANGNAEGWLSPGSYDIDPGASAAQVLRQMVERTIQTLEARQVPPERWQTVLIKASMIEKEARRAEDRPPMARAIENRVAKQMLLQVDATVIYGAGRPIPSDEWVAARKDLDNKYNTYVYPGLPPGPISSPGVASIDAVLNPAPGDWIYWMTVNLETGETKFAVDWPGHQANMREYSQWLENNKS